MAEINIFKLDFDLCSCFSLVFSARVTEISFKTKNMHQITRLKYLALTGWTFKFLLFDADYKLLLYFWSYFVLTLFWMMFEGTGRWPPWTRQMYSPISRVLRFGKTNRRFSHAWNFHFRLFKESNNFSGAEIRQGLLYYEQRSMTVISSGLG